MVHLKIQGTVIGHNVKYTIVRCQSIAFPNKDIDVEVYDMEKPLKEGDFYSGELILSYFNDHQLIGVEKNQK